MRVHVKVPASAILWVIQPAGARQRKGDHNATGEPDRGRRHRRPRIAPAWGRGRALRKSAPGLAGQGLPALSAGFPERDACVILAEGYQRLAEIFEARGSAWRQGGDHNPLSAGVSGLGPSRVA
jgi:hypothetical protein